jgi:hypothetical protein
MYELHLIYKYKPFRFDDCLYSFLQVTGCNYTEVFVIRVLFIFMLLTLIVIKTVTSERHSL